jgi:hypothetical protein
MYMLTSKMGFARGKLSDSEVKQLNSMRKRAKTRASKRKRAEKRLHKPKNKPKQEELREKQGD